MSVPFLDLARAVAAIRGGARRRSRGACSTAAGSCSASAVERFEAAFAAYCGAPHAVGVASGTDAITIALRAVGVGPGDEVITAANTCVPTVAGDRGGGRRRRCSPTSTRATCTLDPASAAAAITDRTRAIVPVHLYGQCADMDALRARARARAAGRRGLRRRRTAPSTRGRRAGTLGDAAAFSFYPTKNLGALGDGGAVVTSRRGGRRARRACCASTASGERYELGRAGLNSRLDELQAALLHVKLGHARRRGTSAGARSRRATTRRSRAGATPADGRRPPHVFHLYVVGCPIATRFRTRARRAGGRDARPLSARRPPAPGVRAPRGPGRSPVSERLARGRQPAALPRADRRRGGAGRRGGQAA